MVFFSLSVESPESVAGDYDAVPAAFGKKHMEGVLRLPVVDCGDKRTLTRREIYKKMALVRQRKESSEYEMCMIQQMNYASCVLIIKETREKPTVMVLPAGQKDRMTIPCFMISRADGQALSKAVEVETVTAILVAAVTDMWGFGNGSLGQLGMSREDSFVSFSVPRLAVQEKGIKSIACGGTHTLVLMDNGTMFTFGNGEAGQLGNGDIISQAAPVFLESLAEQTLVGTIACGVDHSIATGVTMGMWTWGANDYVQLGHSEGCPKVTEPVQVPEMCSRLVKHAAGGYFHTLVCVVNYNQTKGERAEEKRFREEKAKAEQHRGKSGARLSKLPGWLQKAVNSDTDSKDKKIEEKRDRLRLAKQEEVLFKKRCTVAKEVRNIYTWGDGGKGQLGHGELYTEEYFRRNNPKGAVSQLRKFTALSKPRLLEYIMEACGQTGKLGVVVSVAAWGQQSALLTSKGKLLTWGKGELGRLGHGDEKDRCVPTLVTGFNAKGSEDEPIKCIAVGQFSMLALSRALNVYAWGSNLHGQLGCAVSKDPDAPKVRFLACPSFVRNASKKALHSVCCGDTHQGGVTENGEVYIWGQDEGGRLGHENEDEEENPVQWEVKTMLPCDVGVEAGQMAMGSAHTMILTTR